MTTERCTATKSNGQPCGSFAVESGLCNAHRPKKHCAGTRANGEPCRAVVLNEDGLCAAHARGDSTLTTNGGTAFTEARREKFLEMVARGVRRTVAARTVGIHHSTLFEALKNDPQFSEAVELAEETAADQVEDVLWRAATEKGDTKAALAWLESRSPKRWVTRQKRAQVDVNVAGTVVHELGGDSRAAQIERIHALEAKLAERAALRGVVPALPAGVIDAEIVDDDAETA